MNQIAIQNACHRVDSEEWDNVVSSYQRQPSAAVMEPFLDLEFTLDIPFAFKIDDILLLEAYSESREESVRFFEGHLPDNRHIVARLPASDGVSKEVYWLSIDLIRPNHLLTCNWSREERFELTYPAPPKRWKIELLQGPVSTSDGGSRMTQMSPLP